MNDNISPLEIRLAETMTQEEAKILFDWGDDVFGARHISFHCRKSDVHFMGYADGQLVSHLGLVKAEVPVAGQPVAVGGIGGVVTIGPAQHRGYARQMLRQAAAYLCETWPVEFGMLFCLPRLVPFYSGLGWQQVAAPVSIDQPEGRVASPMLVMVKPCQSERVWPAGALEMGLPW